MTVSWAAGAAGGATQEGASAFTQAAIVMNCQKRYLII